jgi:asparagine synthase (glutamine-hydrolysing)
MLEALSEESVQQAGICAPSAIKGLIDRHLSRQANLGYHLWGLLTLHLWMRRWNIQVSSASESTPSAAFASAGD